MNEVKGLIAQQWKILTSSSILMSSLATSLSVTSTSSSSLRAASVTASGPGFTLVIPRIGLVHHDVLVLVWEYILDSNFVEQVPPLCAGPMHAPAWASTSGRDSGASPQCSADHQTIVRLRSRSRTCSECSLVTIQWVSSAGTTRPPFSHSSLSHINPLFLFPFLSRFLTNECGAAARL